MKITSVKEVRLTPGGMKLTNRNDVVSMIEADSTIIEVDYYVGEYDNTKERYDDKFYKMKEFTIMELVELARKNLQGECDEG